MHSKSIQMAKLVSLSIIILLSFSSLSNATTTTWTGGIGDWNVASNWDTGNIPVPTDEVLISSGRVTIPHHYTAYAIQVIIESGSRLTVNSRGALVVANTLNQDAIKVNGTMVNYGQVSVSDISYSNNTFYLDALDVGGRLTNLGNINLANPYHRARGLFVSGSVDNRGNINVIEGGRAIHIYGGRFYNRSSGTIYAQDCGGTIYSTINSLVFENYGDIISLNSTSTGDLDLASDFENKSMGQILLLNSNCYYGISIGDGKTFENDGEIIVDANYVGIVTNGTFENSATGSIEIFSTNSTGIDNLDHFTNKGRIIIDEGALTSISNRGLFENEQEGYIFFQEIDNSHTASFQNEGELDQSASVTAYGGFDNHGIFTNHQCAKFHMRQNMRNYLTGTITNEGLMIHENTNIQTSLNDGVMENHGILEDNVGGLYPLFFNQRIIAKEIPQPLFSGGIISNALTLGSLSNFTIQGWYTSYKLTIEAGTYFASSNAFIPNSFATGLSILYVKAYDFTGGCSVVFEVNFASSFSGGGNSFLSEFEGNSSSQSEFLPYPNPTSGAFHVRLPNDQEGVYELSLLDLTGRILQKKSAADLMNGTVTFTPETPLSNGTYFLQVTQNGQLIKSEKVVIIR